VLLFLLTASKGAGTGFVIEAVTHVIEAVTGVPVFIEGFES